jgi:hypothetical protein
VFIRFELARTFTKSLKGQLLRRDNLDFDVPIKSEGQGIKAWTEVCC